MLNQRQKYLQIALNQDLDKVANIISQIPRDPRVILEAGYPLIKTYGMEAIRQLNFFWNLKFSGKGMVNFNQKMSLPKDFFSSKSNKPYIVADLKCMDRAFVEVEAAAEAGASAATCLGLAPIETINGFIKKCEELKIDSVLDMLNIEYPFEVMEKLLTPPKIVMLHRGVDEGEENKEKEIPYQEIARIKDVYDDILVAVAGGETVNEVMTATFNDADIVVVWKFFNESPQKVASLAKEFLKEIK